MECSKSGSHCAVNILFLSIFDLKFYFHIIFLIFTDLTHLYASTAIFIYLYFQLVTAETWVPMFRLDFKGKAAGLNCS